MFFCFFESGCQGMPILASQPPIRFLVDVCHANFKTGQQPENMKLVEQKSLDVIFWVAHNLCEGCTVKESVSFVNGHKHIHSILFCFPLKRHMTTNSFWHACSGAGAGVVAGGSPANQALNQTLSMPML